MEAANALIIIYGRFPVAYLTAPQSTKQPVRMAIVRVNVSMVTNGIPRLLIVSLIAL
jgi:hypothetical protein